MSWSGPSVPTNGGGTASTSRPCRAASIRTTARFSRPAASTSTWWPPLPLPSDSLAFDVGTGTGVLAAVLARRGVHRVVATDNEPRAIACAGENFRNLGVQDRAEAVLTDMFPPGRAPLIVCNPPWIPATPHSSLDNAVYDPGSRMLFRFLNELPDHLEPGGEGWLVLSDLAEHLGLRSRDDLLGAIEAAGLKVLERFDTRPTHPKASDRNDPLFAARVGRSHLAVAARTPLVPRTAACASRSETPNRKRNTHEPDPAARRQRALRQHPDSPGGVLPPRDRATGWA